MANDGADYQLHTLYHALNYRKPVNANHLPFVAQQSFLTRPHHAVKLCL